MSGIELSRIEVKRNKNASRILGRIISFIIGVAGLLASMILIITIIGIIPGFLLFIASLTLVALSFGFQTVKCPECKKANTVGPLAEDFKCKRCNTPVIIDWIK